METPSALSCVRNLLRKRMILINEQTHSLGVLSQVFLDPANGVLLGFAIRLEGKSKPLLVAINYLLFTENASMHNQIAALTDAFSVVEEFEEGATTYQDFLGADIVTEGGKLCGQIKEVFFDEECLRTVYQVKASGWRGLFGKPFFIRGGDGDFYSYRRRRLILSFAATRFKSLAAAGEGLQSSAADSFISDRTSPQQQAQTLVRENKVGHSIFEK